MRPVSIESTLLLSKLLMNLQFLKEWPKVLLKDVSKTKEVLYKKE